MRKLCCRSLLYHARAPCGGPPAGSPGTSVFHAGPGFLRWQRLALLQKLNRNVIRRADKGHMTITGRTIYRYPISFEVLTKGINVIHPVGQMTKIASAGILFRIPVGSELDHRRPVFTGTGFVFRCSQKYQGESAFVAALAIDLDHSQQIAKEMQCLVQVAHPDHGVKILHEASFRTVLIIVPCRQFTVFWPYGCKNNALLYSRADHAGGQAPRLAMPGASAAAVTTDV